MPLSKGRLIMEAPTQTEEGRRGGSKGARGCHLWALSRREVVTCWLPLALEEP